MGRVAADRVRRQPAAERARRGPGASPRSDSAHPRAELPGRRRSHGEGDVHAHALYELRCDTDGWSDPARSCLATISSDDVADGCLRLLDRDQQRRLAADRARLATDRDDAHE